MSNFGEAGVFVSSLDPWSADIVAAGGFPTQVTQIPAAWGRLE
jgi:hypothetical protein